MGIPYQSVYLRFDPCVVFFGTCCVFQQLLRGLHYEIILIIFDAAKGTDRTPLKLCQEDEC